MTSQSWPGVRRRTPARTVVLALLALLGSAALGLAGCGQSDSTLVATPSAVGSAAATSTPSGSPSGPGASAGGSADVSTASPSAPASLPGTSYDHGPIAGQALAVIGVPVGRTIPVQAAPGPGQPALAAVAPLTKGVVAAGPARLVKVGGTATSVWVKATVSGVTGWIDGAHLAAAAASTDLTTDVIGRLGSRPVGETMLDLGMTVARAYASSEPPSTITVVVAPAVGDLGQITLDVVGLGDDSVAGQRLHVSATPGTESFTLLRVEGTAFCYRGVSPAGLCL